MNKYEKAYESCASGRFGSSHWDLMHKLVERATPKKFVTEDTCPNCNYEQTRRYDYHGTTLEKFKHCPNCGQALDRNDEE